MAKVRWLKSKHIVELGRNLSKEANVRICLVQLPSPLVDWCDVAQVIIDMLPDVAILEIFYFYYLGDEHKTKKGIERWHTLAHVCRKWRNVVFASPHRLNLRLRTTECTRVKETLDIWPLLPIVVDVNIGGPFYEESDDWDEDNIIVALEHNDHIHEINFSGFSSSQSKEVLLAMHRPFPALTRLDLDFSETPVQPQADSFLGGSAPCLQYLRLYRTPFPGLPNLLLSATHLVSLTLWDIPPSGYFSPEAMATCLSVLTNLESLAIGFESPRSPSRPNQHPPPQARILLPIFITLTFDGDNEYLEDLVARIDAPLLTNLTITFFHRPIFDTAQLTQLISRTPKFKGHKAHVEITDWHASISLPQTSDGKLCLVISCGESDLQLSSLAQVCGSFFPRALIHAVEYLYINNGCFISYWDQDIFESRQWLDFLRPFSTVKCLYISWEFAPGIVTALQELVGDRATETLPALQTLFFEEADLSGPVWEAIGRFVAARQLAGHPIAVSSWKDNHFLNN